MLKKVKSKKSKETALTREIERELQKVNSDQTLTEKQKKLLTGLITGNYSTKKQLLLDCGYSESSSVQPSRIIDSLAVTTGRQVIVNKLERSLELTMEELTKPGKFTDAKLESVSNHMDRLIKNIELLSGRATERKEQVINPEQKERVYQFLSKNREKLEVQDVTINEINHNNTQNSRVLAENDEKQ